MARRQERDRGANNALASRPGKRKTVATREVQAAAPGTCLAPGAMKADRRTQGMPYLIIFIIVLVLGLMVSCVF